MHVSNKYIKGFDGLRGISIIFVLITHLGLFEYLELSQYSVKRIVPLVSGGTGVTIFFVISGFLITKILLSEKELKGKISFRNFFARRFLRLLPPLVLYFLALLILMKFEIIKPNFIGLTFSALYLYNFIPKMYYTGELGPTWSLALEEQFYLIWPMVVSFLKKNGALILSVILLIMSVLSYFIYPLFTIQFNNKLYALTDFSHTQRWFIPAISSILIGALTAYFYNSICTFPIFRNNRIFAYSIALVLILNTLYLPESLLQFYTFFYATGISILYH